MQHSLPITKIDEKTILVLTYAGTLNVNSGIRLGIIR